MVLQAFYSCELFHKNLQDCLQPQADKATSYQIKKTNKNRVQVSFSSSSPSGTAYIFVSGWEMYSDCIPAQN